MIDRAELERGWMEGEHPARLAKRLGISESHVYKLRRQFRLPPRKRGVVVDAAEVERAWSAGESVASIANRIGVSQSVIYKLRSREKFNVRLKNGSREPLAPTPEDEIASLSSLRLSPWVQRRVAVLQAAEVLLQNQ